MEKNINTYQGMNKDTAYDTIASTLYIDALDIRITPVTGESMGAFTNIRGNEFAFTIPTQGEENAPFGLWTASGVPEIIGYATIRNKIILFVADDSEQNGWIYDLEYNPGNKKISPNYPKLVYYNANLNFKKIWPIEAVGRYESDCIQRVYWTDYNNFFRSLNIAEDLTSYPLGSVDIFPDLTYTQPLLKGIGGGGSVLGGIYQPAYRLITSDGKETLISPPGNLFHMVADSDTLPQSANYNGDINPGTVNTGKTFTILIDTSQYLDFEKIEFIVVHYASTTAVPVVYSVSEQNIDNQPTVEFIYTGINNSIIELELASFITKNFAFKTPKTITPKDNSLVAANIKGSTIKIKDLLGPGETFDAKTRRYRKIGPVIEPPFPIDPDPLDPTGNNLNNAFNSELNTDAHWNQDWHDNKQYKFQSDGITLGGEGPNINYTFHLEPFTIDGDAQQGFVNISPVPYGFPYDAHNLDDGYGVYNNVTYANHASPFISGLLRGYKRGETYRFGIVFYTNKGETSFVEYIGDVKFPDISEEDSANNLSNTNYWPLSQQSTLDGNKTIGYSMGIKFILDFSTCPTLLTNIIGYQIVRVKKEELDRRRISQGIIRTFWRQRQIAGDPSEAPGGFDLRVEDSEDVLHLMVSYQNVLANSQTFGTMGDHQFLETIGGDVYSNAIPFVAGTVQSGYWIKSNFLGFYSPDVSFNKNNVVNNGTNLANNPCFLMTGGYANTGGEILREKDLTNVNLAVSSQDRRFKRRTVVPVTYNSIENIKKLKESQYFSMPHDCDFNNTVTELWSSNAGTSLGNGDYYLRNYWVIDGWQGIGNNSTLNDPQGGGGSPTFFPEISKSGSNLVVQLDKISNDIFTGTSITSSIAEFFISNNNVVKNNNPYPKITSPIVGNNFFPIIELVIPKKEIYGGNNINTLQSNTFIIASPFIKKNNIIGNTDTVIVFGGDTFLNMATIDISHIEFKEEFFDVNISNNPKYYAHSGPRTETFVVESTLNLDLANGATLRTGVKYSYTSGSTTEEQEVLRQETNNSLAPTAKILNMYNYDLVYSLENDQINFFVDPNPNELENCNVNDVRAYLSNVKINDEKIDSWTKFGVNNFYDIDDYGPINKIVNYKDIVHFIQDRAVGVYAINRAAITTTSDGVPTQLGTGQGFGKHQYFSKVHGSIHQWAVKTSESGIYFFDALARKIFIIQTSGSESKNNPISEVKGMHSWLNNLPDTIFLRKENGGDNPILKKGVHIGQDFINDEIIFTFLADPIIKRLNPNTDYFVNDIVFVLPSFYYQVTSNFTTGSDNVENLILLNQNAEILSRPVLPVYHSLVYDELMQQFSCFYSATPKIWISNSDTLLSTNLENPEDVYIHNIGDWGVFYGNEVECSLTMVLNAQADINKVLRTLEFNSIIRDDNKVIDRTQTITAFEISTEYQTTGKVPFSPDRIKRKFDKWRVKIPRNNTDRGRLRSTHFILTLYFDNSNNKELIMNRLMSYFDYQIF
jgi:hypothetical protein